MDEIAIKIPNPKGRLFLKIEVKGFDGRCLHTQVRGEREVNQ
jgi:hypothetical protein